MHQLPVTSVTCPSQTSEDTPSTSHSPSLALTPFISSQSSASQPTTFQEQPDTPLDLASIKTQSSSHMNFTVRLLKILFEPHELAGKNVQGMRGKAKLNPEKIAKIKKHVFEYFPCSPSEVERQWRDCRKSIDSYIRKKYKSD